MRKTENECVGCGLPCLGSGCPHINVIRFYCDNCGEEDVLYHLDDKELCIECIKEELTVVEGSNF